MNNEGVSKVLSGSLSIKNRSIISKIIFFTVIIFILISFITQASLYKYVKNIVYNMELEKVKNAHSTVYDTFTSASVTNKSANEAMNERTVIISKAIANFLSKSNYSIEEVKEVGQNMGAEEINIIDEQGIIISSTIENNIGKGVKGDEKISSGLDALNGEVVVGPAPSMGTDLIQYISVPRVDKKGVIQIGFSSKPQNKIHEESNPQSSIGQTQIGKTGIVMAFNSDGKIKVHSNQKLVGTFIENEDFLKKVLENESGEIKFVEKGIEYYGIYEKRLGLYITAAMGIKEVEEKAWIVQRTSMIFSIITLIIVVLGVYMIFQKLIAKKIKNFLVELDFVSRGDLTRNIHLDSDDEMGTMFKSFNNTVNSVRDIIKEVLSSAEVVTSSSEELAASSYQLADTSQEISKVIEDIATGSAKQAEDVKSGLEKAMKLEQNTYKLSSLTKELRDISDKIESLKDKGIIDNENVTDKSDLSNLSIEEISKMVSETNESTKKINDIINVINDIASQTSLLALNASIESERSGEAGRGFSVVAEEIKKLAEQSANSVSDIKNITNELQCKSNQTVETMEKVKEIIQEQTIAIDDTKRVFLNLADEIEGSRRKVDELNLLEGEIMSNKSDIMNAFDRLSAVAEYNSDSTKQVSVTTEEQNSSIEELAKFSNNLSELSLKLKEIINRFKI